MSAQTTSIEQHGRRVLPRWVLWLAILLGCGVLVLANTHLVYVSFVSQPECVPHLKAGQAGDGFRAARSSC